MAEISVSLLLLKAAKQDLVVCRLLSGNQDVADAMVGFHAQQAVEKALKAVLSHRGVEFRRTHDLVWLLDLLGDRLQLAPPGADWLDELNPYAVEARYGVMESEELDRLRAVTAAERVIAWADSLLS